ncbi:MAG TPA: alpha/beta fold hydrolase [Trichocoleus sp.]|jgi:pimeloyl-ACP methyl ester carboxylesterase
MQVRIVPSTGAYWQWRGQSIYYVKAGQRHPDRPPLLFVHGFGASTDHWRKNVAGLCNEFEVWAIDMLGFGRSAKPDWEYSADLWRDQLHDFITQIIGQPAVLAGNSLGGYASLCMAAHRPQSVAGLILVNPAGPFTETQSVSKPDPFREVFFNLARTVLLQPLPSLLLFQYVRQRSLIRRTLSQVYLDQSAVTDELVEDIYRPSCDEGAARVFASVFKAPPGAKNDVLLEQMSCPLLMLWGEGDPWMNSRDRGARFRQHYPSLTEYYLQAGHCPHDEVPDQVNALIRDWVLKQPSSIARSA